MIILYNNNNAFNYIIQIGKIKSNRWFRLTWFASRDFSTGIHIQIRYYNTNIILIIGMSTIYTISLYLVGFYLLLMRPQDVSILVLYYPLLSLRSGNNRIKTFTVLFLQQINRSYYYIGYQYNFRSLVIDSYDTAVSM